MVDDHNGEPDDHDPPAPSEVWKVLIKGKHVPKVRPAVIIAAFADYFLVVYGGSKPHPKEHHFVVPKGTTRAKRMGLVKDTHFWHSGVRHVRLDRFKEYLGDCPVYVQVQLDRLAFNFLRDNPEVTDDDAEDEDDG